MALAEQPHIFLWAVPRSISTAFFRAMMNRKKIKVLLEPYSRAYYYSTERVSKRYEKEPIQDGCTYMDIKAQCEENIPGASAVFVKDMAYYLVNRLDSPAVLPLNYRHTFIIRDPHKTVYSLYKMSLNKELTGWDHFDGNEVGFKELYRVYEMVTNELGQEPIVVDADDLLKHPEDILRQYCVKVGLEFEPGMLNWDETPQDMSVFQDWMPWFEGVLTSKKFEPSATKPKSPAVMPQLPGYVQRAIEENMVYYNKMFAKRISPNVLEIKS
jgi:hypothetical protein